MKILPNLGPKLVQWEVICKKSEISRAETYSTEYKYPGRKQRNPTMHKKQWKELE